MALLGHCTSHPVGEVVDFFYRVKFQQRGSPHIHSLFWIKNAPEYGKDTDEDIVKFVDSYISCKADPHDDLVNLQRRKHSKTCKKRGHAVSIRTNTYVIRFYQSR